MTVNFISFLILIMLGNTFLLVLFLIKDTRNKRYKIDFSTLFLTYKGVNYFV